MSDITETIREKFLREPRVAQAQAAEAAATAAEAACVAAEAQATADAAQAAAQAASVATATETATEAKPDEAGKAMAFKAIGTDEFGVIRGIGAAAGSPTKLDLDGEFLQKSDLCAMAFDFCSGVRKFNVNHRDPIDCSLVESWVGAPIIETKSGLRTLKEDETYDPASMNIIGIDIRKGKETHWFVGVRPTDPGVVEIAKSGGIAGFSFGAHVSKTEV